jgi:hypothetical protein
MLSARRRQWIAPDCWVGRVRNDGDDQPLHHLAVANVSEKVLGGNLHALQAGIDLWRSVSPYFMVREVGEVESWERRFVEQWMRDKAGIISCYYSSAASPQGEGARVVWVTGVSLEHRQAKRVNAGRTSESIACKGGCR